MGVKIQGADYLWVQSWLMSSAAVKEFC